MSKQIMADIAEDEMIATFLKAEVASPRFKRLILTPAKRFGIDRKIIFEPNVKDPKENQARKKLLAGYRGYQKNTRLFEGFPKNVGWKRVKLNFDELLLSKYMGGDFWVEITGGTGMAAEGAQRMMEGAEVKGFSNQRFFEIAEEVSQGTQMPELIFVSDGEDLVILEGHSRLTGYFIDYFRNDGQALTNGIVAMVGFSKNMNKWRYYPEKSVFQKASAPRSGFFATR